jgi:aminotransferase
MNNTTLSAIKRIEMEAKKIPGAVSLAQGAPSLSSDDTIRQGVIRAIQEDKVDKYSLVAGLPELRSAISQSLKSKGMVYSPDNEIIVTVGTIEALSAVCLSLLDPNDEVIVFTPTYYTNYKKIIGLAKAKTVTVQLDEQSGWKLDMQALERAINEKTKLILVCSPNNPTGSVFKKDDLLQIGHIAQSKNIFLVLDEVYYNLQYKKEKFSLAQEKQFRNNIIRITSLSKDFSLAGWRIGFLHAPKELTAKILSIHDSLSVCAPVVSQYAALAALKNEETILLKNINEYSERRKIMGESLAKMKNFLEIIEPKGAFYFFPKIYDLKNDMDFCLDLLHKAKVAVVPGSEFGPGGEGHIRLCFGRSREDIQEGMIRLNNYFLESRKKDIN